MQALWMLLASAMFALMGSSVKLATEHNANLAQIVLFRGLPSVLLLLVFARAGRHSLLPATSWKLHFWRNVCGVTSMWVGFFALSRLPLSTATSLNYTAPLFIACWMLGWGGARRDPIRVGAVVMGFLGVIAVLRPSVAGDQWLAAALGLSGGALSAVAMLQLRELGNAGEQVWRTVLFFSAAVTVTSVIVLFWLGWDDTDWIGYLALACVGAAGLCGQLAVTRAFGSGSPLLTAALQYTTIIFAALIAIGFWDENLDWIAWAGIGLIIMAGLASVWRTMQENRLPPKPSSARADG